MDDMPLEDAWIIRQFHPITLRPRIVYRLNSTFKKWKDKEKDWFEEANIEIKIDIVPFEDIKDDTVFFLKEEHGDLIRKGILYKALCMPRKYGLTGLCVPCQKLSVTISDIRLFA